MAPYIDTAIQWLHDTIRVQVRARREAEGTADAGANAAAERPAFGEDWVTLCWEVGHSLTMMQAHGIPAQPVIDAVSDRLISEFGSEGDFTPYGIRTMRQFYLDYFERPHLQPLIRVVPWDCHKLILALCRDPSQQEYYLELCRSEGMTSEALAEAVKSRRYELSAALGKPDSAKAFPKTTGKQAGSSGKQAGATRKGQGRSTASLKR